jgi:HK97 family phage major capsid protein
MLNDTQALGAKVEALRAEIVELDAIEAPTEEQAARFDAALVEFDAAKADFDKANERAAKVEAVRAAAVNPVNREAGFAAPNVIVRKDPYEGLENLRYSAPQEQVSRALNALESTRGDSASIDEVARKVETIPGAAALVLATGSDAYRSAFSAYLRDGARVIHTPEEAMAVRTAMSLTSANGGYALPFLLDPTLIHTGTATKNPIRSIARVVQGTQNVWHGTSAGNVTTYWKAEGSAFTEGSPTLAGPTVTAALLSAYAVLSYEIFEDSSLASQLPGLIAESMSYAEGTAFISGSGSGAPKGIVTAVSGTAASTVTATTRGAFTTASAVDVFNLLNALPSRYEDNATWVANKQTFNTIKQMSTGSQGSYFWSDFNAAIGNPLLGSPIVQASDMATAQTSGTKLIVLGDFSQFVIYDRLGVSIEVVANVVDGSGLPTGQRGILAHKRVGSDVTDVNAFRIFNT